MHTHTHARVHTCTHAMCYHWSIDITLCLYVDAILFYALKLMLVTLYNLMCVITPQ